MLCHNGPERIAHEVSQILVRIRSHISSPFSLNFRMMYLSLPNRKSLEPLKSSERKSWSNMMLPLQPKSPDTAASAATRNEMNDSYRNEADVGDGFQLELQEVKLKKRYSLDGINRG